MPDFESSPPTRSTTTRGDFRKKPFFYFLTWTHGDHFNDRQQGSGSHGGEYRRNRAESVPRERERDYRRSDQAVRREVQGYGGLRRRPRRPRAQEGRARHPARREGHEVRPLYPGDRTGQGR